jgi:hypothetical protein
MIASRDTDAALNLIASRDTDAALNPSKPNTVDLRTQ